MLLKKMAHCFAVQATLDILYQSWNAAFQKWLKPELTDF